jgi:hypothetical protein
MLAVLTFGSVCAALTPAYLRDMPTVAQVEGVIHESDPIDNQVKLATAFNQLCWIVRSLSAGGGTGSRMTPDETAQCAAYGDAARKASTRGVELLGPHAPAYGPGSWPLRSQRYAPDSVRAEMLDDFPAIKSLYDARQQDDARKREDLRKVNPTFDDYVVAFLRPIVAAFVVFVVFAALVLRREVLPFELVRTHQFEIHAGGRRHVLASTTGIALDPKKRRVVTKTFWERVDWHTGRVVDRSVDTNITIYEDFTIQTADQRVPVTLANANVGLQHGHVVSAAWALRDGQRSNQPILFRNHATGKDYNAFDNQLRSILGATFWTVIVPIVASLFFAVFATAGLAEVVVRNLGAVWVTDVFFLLLAPCITLVPAVALVVWSRIGARRVRRVKASLDLQFMPMLDAAASTVREPARADWGRAGAH